MFSSPLKSAAEKYGFFCELRCSNWRGGDFSHAHAGLYGKSASVLGITEALFAGKIREEKNLKLLIEIIDYFLSTQAAAASTKIAGAMFIAGAPVEGFASPFAAAEALILITAESLSFLEDSAPGLMLF